MVMLPTRHQLRRFATSFIKLDPTLFLTSVALWSATQAIGLFTVPNVFALLPSFKIAHDIGLKPYVVGSGMLLDAICITCGVVIQSRIFLRITVIMSAFLWFFWSAIALASALIHGFVSGFSLYGVFVSIGLFLCGGGVNINGNLTSQVLMEAYLQDTGGK